MAGFARTKNDHAISDVSIITDRLVIHFEDGRRVILRSDVIYALESDPASEAEIAFYEKQYGNLPD